MIRYPYGCHQITADDIGAVTSVLHSSALTQGPEVAKFEAAFESETGARNAVAVSNGTAALHLAYVAAGLGPERGLITSPVTFLATAAAARMLGAPVAFADVDVSTGLITPETAARAIELAPFEVGAITAVHLGGRMCDVERLQIVAESAGAVVVEDASHAPGAKYRCRDGRRIAAGACEHSDFATFSFHPVKHIATAEGGAVCCRDLAKAERLKRLRTHGMDRRPESLPKGVETGPWYYANTEIGFNYRLTDIQAALGTSQLKRFGEGLQRRRDIARAYGRLLEGLASLTLPPAPEFDEQHAWHLYAAKIDFKALGKPRARIMEELAAHGIGTQVHYIPLYRQAAYLGRLDDYPGAEAYYEHTLSLPMYPALTDEDLEAIAAACHSTFRN